MKVLVVLGAPNDSSGRLSEIALGRANTAISEYAKHPGCKVLLTGGFGEHFNTTDSPHAYYVSRYLVRHGVAETDILEFAESSNTIEDAVLARQILRSYDIESLIVITSGFHLKRVRLIFEYFFPAHVLEFVEAPALLTATEHQRVCLHEREELKRIEDSGVLIKYRSSLDSKSAVHQTPRIGAGTSLKKTNLDSSS